MKERVKYQNWPLRVRILTAVSNKRFVIRDYRIPMVIGCVTSTIGAWVLLYFGFVLDIPVLSLGFATLILAIVNIMAGYAVKWITDNSSWEERFENSSAVIHRILYLIILVISILLPVNALYPIFNSL